MNDELLARKLQILRAEKGWTLRQASAEMGLTKESIMLLERGQRSPRATTLKRLADGYGVPVEELFFWDEGKGAAPTPGPTSLEDLDTLLGQARELRAEWARLMDYDRMTRPGEYERVRPRLAEIERRLDELRRRAQELDAPRHMIMRWPNRPPRVVFFEEPTEAEEAELRAAVGAYEEERVFSHAS